MKPINCNAKANLIVSNLVFCVMIVFFYSCGSGSSGGSSGTGSVSFGLTLQDSDTSRALNNRAANDSEIRFECKTETYEIATIEAQVLDENGELLAEGGPFDCEDGQGDISGVEAGDNRKAKVSAKNSAGIVIFAGESGPLTVEGGKTTEAGTITLNRVEVAPVAKDDTATTDEDTPTTINVLGNDEDANGDTLTVSAVNQGRIGTVTTDGTSVTYTPNADLNGSDSFSYTVSDGTGTPDSTATVRVTVTPVNDPPVARDDSFENANSLQVFSVDNALDVLNNDEDPVENDPLNITRIISPPSRGGSVRINSNGDGLLYTPATGFFGTETFEYEITDVPGGTLSPETAAANVTVNVTATISRVSVNRDDSDANLLSERPAMNLDGRFVAFVSEATDLIQDDTNGRSRDVFVRDRQQKATDLISVSTNGIQGDDDSGVILGDRDTEQDTISVSSDAAGRFVAFSSISTNLVDGTTDAFVIDIFVRDREPGMERTERVSVDMDDGEPNGDSTSPSISEDGQFVAFQSDATDLVNDDTRTGVTDIYVRDRRPGMEGTERISINTNDEEPNGNSFDPSISADGQFVAFESEATDLVIDDTRTFVRDIYVRDRQPGMERTERISINTNGEEPNGHSFNPSISADGRFVVFESDANDLVDQDNNNQRDIFVRDRIENKTARVSIAFDGSEPDLGAFNSVISADGLFVAFDSLAENLVEDDANDVRDVFEARNPLIAAP